MSIAAATDTALYKVIVNQEEQYSLWPAHKPSAPGWRDAGSMGSEVECLAYIKEIWTDMRPRALRDMMADQQDQQ
ncbi:MAG: MbtH family protein [Proteobacteria bacterium]|nr:MbtH family protein [Pseudomonadota bacterium]